MKKFLVILLSTIVILTSCGEQKIDPVSQKVMNDINSIGEVTLEDEELINTILETYKTLTDNQKEQVDNYIDLLNAQDALTQLKEMEATVYSEEEMFAVANSISKLLSSQWESVGIVSECCPSLADDSIIIIARFDIIDSTQYTTEELIKLLEEYNIDSTFGNLPVSIMDSMELKNVVLDIIDTNGEILYLFHNSEKAFQIGDESHNLPIKLITPKKK